MVVVAGAAAGAAGQPEMPKRWDSASARRSVSVSARPRSPSAATRHTNTPISPKQSSARRRAFYDAWHYSREEAERQSGAYRYAREFGEGGGALSAFTRSSRFSALGMDPNQATRCHRRDARDGRFASTYPTRKPSGRSTRHISGIHDRADRAGRRRGRASRRISRRSDQDHRLGRRARQSTRPSIRGRVGQSGLSEADRHVGGRLGHDRPQRRSRTSARYSAKAESPVFRAPRVSPRSAASKRAHSSDDIFGVPAAGRRAYDVNRRRASMLTRRARRPRQSRGNPNRAVSADAYSADLRARRSIARSRWRARFGPLGYEASKKQYDCRSAPTSIAHRQAR